MVFVKFNRALKHRYERTNNTHPILLADVDECNEWLMGCMNDENEIAYNTNSNIEPSLNTRNNTHRSNF